MVDVLMGAPESLTHREKLLLLVLAEDANEDTRITWNSVERPEVLRGAKLSRSQLYAVLKSLTAKGALERLSAGQKNAAAKYRIKKFPSFQSPRIRDTDQSQCQENADTEPQSQCQENADTDQSQCQEIRDVSVPESGTPTPHPSTSQQEEASSSFDYGIPTDVRPLMDSMTASGIKVRWPFQGNDWFRIIALINKCGIPALVEHAYRANTRAPVDSARYFLKGWSELPPKPANGTPIYQPQPITPRRHNLTPEERGIF